MRQGPHEVRTTAGGLKINIGGALGGLMGHSSRLSHRRGAAVALAVASALGHGAAAAAPGWSFVLQPYVWLPAISTQADLTVPGRPGLLPGQPEGTPRQIDISVKADPDNYLDDLQLAMMLSGEARYGRFALLTDLIWVDFSGQAAHVRQAIGPFGQFTDEIGRQASLGLEAVLWTVAAGYRVAETPWIEMDLLGGARYVNVSTDIKVSVLDTTGGLDRQHRASLDQEQWSGIIGARGRVRLAERWSLPWYADIGAGNGNQTWQAMLGLAYGFRAAEVSLAWRVIDYDFDRHNADLTMSGPAIGVAWRW